MDVTQLYHQKLRTAQEAVRLVKDGDWVDYSQSAAFPEALDSALAQRRGELADVKVRGGIALKPVQVVEQDPEQQSFTYHVWHCSAIDRGYIDRGLAFFQPMLFRDCGSYYARGFAKVDVAMLSVAPMDKDGNFSFSIMNGVTREIVDSARTVILEVCPGLPVVYGRSGDHIHITEADAVVEGGKPAGTASSPQPTPIDRQIAGHILPHLRDGITLQLGIGGMPNALGALIAQSDLKDIGIHTEMMGDGYLALYRVGKVTNRKKEIDRGKGVFSVGAGSQELYQLLDRHMGFLSAPMGYVNDPMTIRQFSNFVSINGCISMDLYGQVCSESTGIRQISGTGGQLDFVTGAYMSEHGKAFLSMSSVFTDRQGYRHSRILPRFTQGDIVTTPRAQAPCIVTEYGVACLSGLATWQRSEAIIAIAHPDFREDLIQAAQEQGIWRRSQRR